MMFGVPGRNGHRPSIICSSAKRGFNRTIRSITAGFWILAIIFAASPNTASAQAPSNTTADNACRVECNALRLVWQTAGQTLRKARTKLEKVEDEYRGLTKEWARLNATSLQLRRAVNVLYEKAVSINRRSEIDKSIKSRSQIENVKADIAQTYKQMAEIEKKRQSLTSQLGLLRASFSAAVAGEITAKVNLHECLRNCVIKGLTQGKKFKRLDYLKTGSL